MNDLGKIEINDDLISLLSKEVAVMLAGKDLNKIIEERNALLVNLAALKSKAVNLP
jgi:hypothetical protein